MNSSIPKKCFVAGASRGVGFEVVKKLRQRNYIVAAFIRTSDTQTQLKALGAQVLIGDALEETVVTRALQHFGTDAFTVVTTIGGKGITRDEPRSDYLGNRNLIDGTKSLPCQRFLLISSIGVGDSAIALPPPVLETLRSVLLAKAKAEQHLISSGLPYTIIRPGGLLSEPATSQGLLTENYRVAGSITRTDIAELIIQCMQSNKAENRVLSAIDRDRLRSEQLIEPFHL